MHAPHWPRPGAALLALKLSTLTASSAHAASGVFTLWDNTSHPCGDATNNMCAWPGITCDVPEGSVLALDLSAQGLRGTLPKELAHLTLLRQL